MGYTIESNESFNTVSNDTPIGISTTFDSNRLFDTTLTTNDSTYNNLKNLLLTRKGERINQPNFGTNLMSLLFEPNTEELSVFIQQDIMKAITTWLPFIDVVSIIVDEPTADSYDTVTIKLTYTIRSTPDSLNVLTINSNESQISITRGVE